MTTDARGTPDTRKDLFGGSKTVRVFDLLRRAGPAPAPFTTVLVCELDPGGSVGAHRQEHDDELIVGVRGQGQATVDGTPRPLAAYDVVPLPRGAVLTIENRSADEPLEYLIIKARRL